jgi:hypothetical protein
MKATDDETFLTVSSAARLAKRSEACIRLAEKKGTLPALRTATGARLFRECDVMKAFSRNRNRGKS